MSYFKVIEGKKLDGRLVDLVTEIIKDRPEQKLYLEDARRIYNAIAEDTIYTETEKNAVVYILKNYAWNREAQDWFQEKLSGFSKDDTAVSMSPEEVATQQFPDKDVLYTPEAQEARLHDLKTAMVETGQDHDDIGLIVRLASGKRVEVVCNFIEVAGEFVQLRGGHVIPVRAVEKVAI